MILGLNGLKGSGKDTVAAYLIKEYGFERRAFADPLKKSVAALFDIPYHEIDKLKNDSNVIVTLHNESHTSPSMGSLPYSGQGMTFREFLQRYGTEAHRGVFGENFWLDHTLPKDAFYAGRKIAITDLRFDNEAERVRLCGGYVIRIDRPDLDTSDVHASEQPLDPRSIDLILQNDGTLDRLYELIEIMLTHLGDGKVANAGGTR